NWPKAVDRFVKEADKRVEKIDLAQLLECDFSTTTSNSLTASRIVLLDMVKVYFKYRIAACCGIPKVTFEGTHEDWTKLQEKVIKLRNLNLELDFWLDRLDPAILKLVDTYRGEIDEDFWSKIITKKSYGSGGNFTINGWIAAFFPYDPGFIGASQEVLEDFGGESVVSPVIGWAVIDDVKDSSNNH
ncbi:14192_t:CDS:2, partial [Dentiscutata heterogama]